MSDEVDKKGRGHLWRPRFDSYNPGQECSLNRLPVLTTRGNRDDRDRGDNPCDCSGLGGVAAPRLPEAAEAHKLPEARSTGRGLERRPRGGPARKPPGAAHTPPGVRARRQPAADAGTAIRRRSPARTPLSREPPLPTRDLPLLIRGGFYFSYVRLDGHPKSLFVSIHISQISVHKHFTIYQVVYE